MKWWGLFMKLMIKNSIIFWLIKKNLKWNKFDGLNLRLVVFLMIFEYI